MKKIYKNKERKDRHQFQNSGFLYRGREETGIESRNKGASEYLRIVFLYCETNRQTNKKTEEK